MMYQIHLLKSKIHGATITDANVQYEGSLSLDPVLMEAADMLPYEKVAIVNNNNGERIETYLIAGKKGSGECCLNGAAARKGLPGDTVIIMSFAVVEKSASTGWKATRVFVDEKNKIKNIDSD